MLALESIGDERKEEENVTEDGDFHGFLYNSNDFFVYFPGKINYLESNCKRRRII